ncbi:MAG: PGPGW domain-containing protein [Phycisphaeraceae bacterium]
MLAWLEDYEALLWSLTTASVVMFIATLITMPLLIARLPSDYFTRRPVRDWPSRRPALHLLLVVLKNGLGLVLLLAGLAMLLLPGQGLLTVLVGILLLDFPGKRRLQRWLIRRRPIFRAANWIRAKRHRPPLELPPARFEEPGRPGR